MVKARSSVVEHCFDVARVSGSSPLGGTIPDRRRSIRRKRRLSYLQIRWILQVHRRVFSTLR